jgi:hypothetical protein
MRAIPIFYGQNGTLFLDNSAFPYACSADGGFHEFFKYDEHLVPWWVAGLFFVCLIYMPSMTPPEPFTCPACVWCLSYPPCYRMQSRPSPNNDTCLHLSQATAVSAALHAARGVQRVGCSLASKEENKCGAGRRPRSRRQAAAARASALLRWTR